MGRSYCHTIFVSMLITAVIILFSGTFNLPAARAGEALTGLDGAGTAPQAASAQQSEVNAAAGESSTGTVNDTSSSPPCWWLNIRKGPGIRFDVLKVIKGGTKLSILEKDVAGGWFKVADGGVTGWVSSKYFKADSVGSPPAANGSDLKSGWVDVSAAGRLNVRTAPWGGIVGKLQRGTVVSITGREGDWYVLSYNGGKAYAHSDFIKPGNGPGQSSGGNDQNQGGTGVDSSGSGGSSTGISGGGKLNPSDFGFGPRYQGVFDLVQQFCDSNQAYVFGAGHKWEDGFASKTDCSGFTGSFYQKLAAASGIPPVFGKRDWYPSSQVYKTKYTKKITSSFPPPNPRDMIKPGDIFVMNPGSSGVGHVGLFMGYDKSGNPVIAHSTPSKRANIYGKSNTSGVRIEVLPRSYQSRWSGVYRIDGTDKMLDALSKS